MSAICGIITLDGTPVNPDDVRAMSDSASVSCPDGTQTWTSGNAVLSHSAFHVTPESVHERQPLVSPDGRYVLVADARIDNRDELIAALRGEPHLTPVITDTDLILAAFRRWGEACPERLLGDFAFAIWDIAEQRLFLVRDALGGRGLYYHFDGRRCLFATVVGQILDAPGWQPRIHEGKIGSFLINPNRSPEDAFFQSIFNVAPAHCLAISRKGIRKRRYWDIDPGAQIRYRDDREYAEHFRELLTEATRCRMRSIGPIGLSLSGGLDSTLLAAMSSQLLPQVHPTQARMKTFSYVFDRLKDSDERQYIQPLTEHYGLDAVYLACDDKWALKDLAHWPVERDYVWCEVYSWLVIEVAEAARASGCRVLLTGLYGDSLFAGQMSWATEMIMEGRFRDLFRLWRANSEYISWRYDFIWPGLAHVVPAGLKRVRRKLKSRATWKHSALQPEFARRIRLREHAGDDPRRRTFTRPGQWARLAMMSDNTWAELLSEGRNFYHRYGLEAESPYFDRRMVEYAMALPADQLGRPGRYRWIQRNAMQGLLPEAVHERPGKTDFEPLTRLGLFERETDTVRSLLVDSWCEQMGIIRGDWIRQTLARQGQLDERELTTFWRVISLELWLRRLAEEGIL